MKIDKRKKIEWWKKIKKRKRMRENEWNLDEEKRMNDIWIKKRNVKNI